MLKRLYIKWLVWRGKAVDIWSNARKGNAIDRQSQDNPLALFSARGLFLFYLIEMVTILTHYS